MRQQAHVRRVQRGQAAARAAPTVWLRGVSARRFEIKGHACAQAGIALRQGLQLGRDCTQAGIAIRPGLQSGRDCDQAGIAIRRSVAQQAVGSMGRGRVGGAGSCLGKSRPPSAALGTCLVWQLGGERDSWAQVRPVSRAVG